MASSSPPPPPGALHDAFLLLGSNIRPAECLPAARRLLEGLGRVVRASRVWESSPVGFADQANFCNGAIHLQTALTPAELKERLREIEAILGRVRDPDNRNAPRTIDLDIGLYDDWVSREAGLTIPDPDVATRAFVAIPLAEIAPNTRHPVTGRRLAEIAADLENGAGLQPRADILL